MSDGCTNCGKKGGCDSRKHGMFAALEGALARLYPTRRWGERDDAVAMAEGIAREEGEALAEAIARKLGTAAVFRPGDLDEWCDYVYVLCVGRTPSIAELREALAAEREDRGSVAEANAGGAASPAEARWSSVVALDETGIEERYLRVVLSSVARFAGVQEISMTLEQQGTDVVITERARSGVFDPVLLPRFQSLVALLVGADIRHLDFGEIVEAPEGFDPGDYGERFGADGPLIANYFFYPQPPTAVATSVFDVGGDASPRARQGDASSSTGRAP